MTRSWKHWTATALFTLAAGSAAAADLKPFAEILPESTSVFLSIRNLPEVLRWHETSDLKSLVKDPDMQPFLKKLSESFDAMMAEMRKEAGFTLADLKEVCTGEVALALGDPADFVTVMEKGGDGPILLLADVRGKKDQVRELLKKALDKTTVRKRDIEFRGQTIIALEPREDEKEKARKDPTVYLLHTDDLLALSLSRPFLQDTLANREQADVKPLSQVAEFKDLREKYGKDAAVFVYAHSGRWLDKIPAIAKAIDEADSAQVTKILEVLGISRVRALCMSTALSTGEARSTYFFLAPSGPGGLLNTFWIKPRAMSFPALIPEDVASAMVAQVDFGALWKTIEEAIRAFGAGGGEQGMDPLKMVEAQLGINLKDDFIAPLGGQVAVCQRPGKDPKPGEGDFAVLVDLKDREKFQATLEKLLAMVPFFQKREYLGRSVWGFGVPGQAPEGEGAPDISLSVMDTHLVVAGKPLVEEVLRRVGKEVKSLKDTPDFKAIESLLPASTTFLSYDSPRSFASSLDTLRGLWTALQGAAGDGDDEEDGDAGDDADGDDPPPRKKAAGTEERREKMLKDLIKALPEGKVLARHVTGAISYSFVEDRGMGFKSHLVLRKAEKRE